MINPKLTIIVPIFNQADTILPFYRRLLPVLKALPEPTEIIFVNDGSTDHSQAKIEDLACCDPRVSFLELSRHFGLLASLHAGLSQSLSDRVLIWNPNEAEPIESIPDAWERSEEGLDVVSIAPASHSLSFLARPESVSCVLSGRAKAAMLESMKEGRSFVDSRKSIGFRQTVLYYPAPLLSKPKLLLSELTQPLKDLRFYQRISTCLALFCFAIGIGLLLSQILFETVPDFSPSTFLLSGLQLLLVTFIFSGLDRIRIEMNRSPQYFISDRGGETMSRLHPRSPRVHS